MTEEDTDKLKLKGKSEENERAAKDKEGAGWCDLASKQGRIYGILPILTAARDFHCNIS